MRQCEDHSGPVRAGSTWGPGRDQNGVLNGNPDRSPFHTAAEDRRGAEDGEKHQNYKSSDRDTVCGLRSDGYLRAEDCGVRAAAGITASHGRRPDGLVSGGRIYPLGMRVSVPLSSLPACRENR